MSLSEKEFQPLPHHKKAWNQKAFLAHIVERFFIVHSQHGGRWPMFTVEPRHDDDVHVQHQHLVEHMHKLGWMVQLRHDEPWSLTFFPLPERQFPSRTTSLIFWGLSFLTLTLAGDQWGQNARPSDGWFSENAFLDAVLTYSFPVLFTIFIASIIQRHIAHRYGVRSGHLWPIPDFTIALFALNIFPSSWMFWPFGIFLIPSMPRMDARPWPDRASLGFTALSVPLTLMFCGTTLFFTGLWLTPEVLPLTSMPVVTNPPEFFSIIATELISFDSLIRLSWAHPFIHAGGLLLLLGWVSLLPIPTFPGGRILVARMGIREARNSVTQVMLLLTVFLFAFLYGAFDGFSLWYLILGLILPLLLFMGSDTRIPVVLNETKGMEDSQHARMGLFLLLAFLLVLPSQQPVTFDRDWDDELTFSIDSKQVAELGENGTWFELIHISIENPSSRVKPFAIASAFEFDAGWELNWQCEEHLTISLGGHGCGDEVLPGRRVTFHANITWERDDSPVWSNYSVFLEMNGQTYVSEHHITPRLPFVVGDHWYDRKLESMYLRCVSTYSQFAIEDSVNLSFPDAMTVLHEANLVHLEQTQNLTSSLSKSANEICLESRDPLAFDAHVQTLNLSENTFSPLLPTYRRPLIAYMPDEGWNITHEGVTSWGSLLDQGGVLRFDRERCLLNQSINAPGRPLEGAWIWDARIRTSGVIPYVEPEQTLTLVNAGPTMILCQDQFSIYPSYEFQIRSGPQLMATWMNTTTRFWSSPFAIAYNGTLINQNMGVLTFHNPNDAPIPLRLNQIGDVGYDWGHNWNGSALLTGSTTLEFSPPQSEYASLWIAYEGGSIVINLACYD